MPIARRPSLLLCFVVLVCGCMGCASWTPWQRREKAIRDQEKYGYTADTRIKKLAERSKSVKGGSAESRIEFTQELVGMMLAEHDPRVRGKILETAAEYDTAAATAICAGAMQDPSEMVRLKACDIWSKRGGEEGLKLLTTRYQTDTELDVRLRALKRIGDLEDKAAIPVLARALEDADPAVQYRAVAALKQVSGRDLGNDVNVWREWAADPAADKVPWTIAEGFRKVF